MKELYQGKPCKYGHGTLRRKGTYECEECFKVRRRKYAKTQAKDHPEAHRNRQLKYKFGVDLDWYNKKLVEQEGKCAICKRASEKTLHVDHNHTTGQVRDLLCFQCNNALGQFNDDIDSIFGSRKVFGAT